MRYLVYTMKDGTKFFLEKGYEDILFFSESGKKRVLWKYNKGKEELVVKEAENIEEYEVALQSHFMVKRIDDWIKIAKVKEAFQDIYDLLWDEKHPMYETPEQCLFRHITNKIGHDDDIYASIIKKLCNDEWKEEFSWTYPMANYDFAKNKILNAVPASYHLLICSA